MTRVFAPGRGVLVTSLVVLAVFHPRPSVGQAPPARATLDPKLDAALARFEAWHRQQRASTDAAALAEGVTLARERRQALLYLARTDPAQVLARALPPSALRRLPPAVRQQSEEYVDACSAAFDFEIADDFTSADVPVSHPKRTLTVGGRTYEARVFGRRLGLPSRPIHANGVAVDGTIVLFESPLRLMDREEAAEDPAVRAQCGAPGAGCLAAKVGAQTLVFRDQASLRRHQAALEKKEERPGPGQKAGGPEEAFDPFREQAKGAGEVGIASAWTTGEKRLLYIRVDFSDLPGEPVGSDVVQSTIDEAVSTYYAQTSYDKTSLRATVTPLLRVARTAAEYRTIGDGQLLTDARAAALAAGFDPATFDRDIVAFARLFDGYSGKARVGNKGVWLNGSFGAGVTAHELGHNYGVHHANLWRTTDGSVIGAGSNVEYGNVFDVMGRGGTRGQFNAWFKSRMDWLTPADFTSVSASGSYRIDPVDDPAATGPRALKIVKDTTRNYWLEFRQQFTSNRWAMNGLMLNWGYNTNTGSHLLDTTPGSSNNQSDAPLLVGRTFSDATSGIHVTPVARSTSPPAMDVVVKLGTFPDNSPPAATLAASATTVGRNAPVTLTVSATDANGDALAYGWVFDDGTLAPNSASVTKSWSTTGTKTVQCLVSDMVGGLATVSTTITVTSTSTFSISGTVTASGQGLSGVVVSDGTRSGTTGSSGAYTIAGVPNGTYTLTPRLDGFTFSPASLSVTVSGANLTGRSFAATPVGAGAILEAHFDAGPDGFAYADDAFRATAQPGYAGGTRIASGGFSGGALRVSLGGIDEADVVDMSGGWSVSFTLSQAEEVGLSFRYRVSQTADYESDERSEFLASVDGTPLGAGGLVAQIAGDGNGGTTRTSGFQLFQASLGTLAAGPHTLTLGGFNSKKTTASESTELLVDDVLLFRP